MPDRVRHDGEKLDDFANFEKASRGQDSLQNLKKGERQVDTQAGNTMTVCAEFSAPKDGGNQRALIYQIIFK
jgi:hypothetical protein